MIEEAANQAWKQEAERYLHEIRTQHRLLTKLLISLRQAIIKQSYDEYLLARMEYEGTLCEP